MSSYQEHQSSPDIAQIVHDIELEESRFERELRLVARKKVVLPVTLRSLNGAASLRAYSRNLSAAGVSLITERAFNENSIARLKIIAPRKTTQEIIAECKWCQPFAQDCYLTGWHFLRLASDL